MLIMLSNNTGFQAGVLFGKYPDRVGHLQAPEHPKRPMTGVPWALDNGVFGAWQGGREWEEEPFYRYLDAFAHMQPMWAVVPDWVGDMDRTLMLWDIHAPAVQAHGIPLAFAVQDGMTPEHVPPGADVIFVGGTTAWKWRNLRQWTEHFPRVHVGRVNTYRLLWMCHEAGAESCDGTGWFRGDQKQLRGLHLYLEEATKGLKTQGELHLCSDPHSGCGSDAT